MSLTKHLQSLDDGTLVLASTDRVARHLKMQAALMQSVAGKRSWFAKGTITTVSKWIEQAWLELLPSEQLLYPVQELAIVKSVADRSGLLPENLISSTSTARRIAQAYSTFIKFLIPADIDRFRFKREYEVFWQWRELIQEDCRKNACVFRAELPARLLAAIDAGEVALPKKVLMVGMLYLNPAEQAVIDRLATLGIEVVVIDSDESAEPRLIRATTQADEFDHVAQWVNDTLSPFIDNPQAAPSMAILVPDMKSFQAPLIEALTLSVSPAALVPSIDGKEVREAWDVSSGATLGQRPIIRSAMNILSLTNHSADPEVFSRVLRSSWIGGSHVEGAQRAMVDVWLRENSGMNMGGKDYLRALAASKTTCTIFTENLSKLLEAQEEGEKSRYPSEWAEFFQASLKRMGWPHAEQLSSANYQTLEAWDKALKVFRSLDYQLGPCVYERAYAWLREIVEVQQFQPRLSHVAPVSIMSYADAVGLSFDHVWVVGASNKVLPLPADPNPFIPVDLLADAGVPEATSDGQLAKAQRLVAALLCTSTKQLTVSCHEQDERGAGVGGSELFGSWPAAVRCDAPVAEFIGNEVGSLDRSVYAKETVPPVGEEERKSFKGGVSVFKNYATEPFFAFACNRLGATAFPEPVIGFAPRIQGTMMHLCLELFWRVVRTQAALLEMDSAQLDRSLTEAIEAASIKLLYKLRWRFGNRLIALEQGRLKALLSVWMEEEKARELPFEVIGYETKTEVDVHGLIISVSLDRIDLITFINGQKYSMLFDYKSGANFTFNSLNATKLLEPQLPIYASQVKPKDIGVSSIEGITLAQVHAKKMHMHTRSSFTAHLDGGKSGKNDVCAPTAWTEQIQSWDAALELSAINFLAGNASLSDIDMTLNAGFKHLAPLI